MLNVFFCQDHFPYNNNVFFEIRFILLLVPGETSNAFFYIVNVRPKQSQYKRFAV